MATCTEGQRAQSVYGCFPDESRIFYSTAYIGSRIVILYLLRELVFVRFAYQYHNARTNRTNNTRP